MSRYIDADALYQTIDAWRKKLVLTYGEVDDYVECLGDVLDIVEDAPTEDVVKVVRCRDCEYWDPGSPMATVIPTPCRCRLRRETDATTAEDFCSYGRRKEKTDG